MLRHELSATNPLGSQLEPRHELRPGRPFRARAHSLWSVLPDVMPQLRALVFGWICGFLLVVCGQAVRERAAHPQTSPGSSAQRVPAAPRSETDATPAAARAARSSASQSKFSGADRQPPERRSRARTRASRALGKATRRAR